MEETVKTTAKLNDSLILGQLEEPIRRLVREELGAVPAATLEQSGPDRELLQAIEGIVRRAVREALETSRLAHMEVVYNVTADATPQVALEASKQVLETLSLARARATKPLLPFCDPGA